MEDTGTAEALRACLITPNEGDSNGEPANIVDGLFAIARSLDRVADAIRTRPEPATEEDFDALFEVLSGKQAPSDKAGDR